MYMKLSTNTQILCAHQLFDKNDMESIELVMEKAELCRNRT